MSAAPTVQPVAGRTLFYGAAALMVTALLLGGGGGGAPLQNMIIEFGAVVLLTVLFWRPAGTRRTRAEVIAIAVLGLILATPLLQLIPLPFAIWSRLPGRDFVVQVDQLIGNLNSWRPISLDPEATWNSAAAILPGAALFLVTLRLGAAHRRKLAIIVISVSFLSAALGMVQLASAGEAGQIYSTAHDRFATGLLANRNHQADLMLIAMLLSSAVIWGRKDRPGINRLIVWITVLLAFSAATVATGSRFGFVFITFAVLGSLSFAPIGSLRRFKGLTLLGAAGLIGAFAFIAMSAGTERVLDRFDNLSDSRFEFWPDAMVAAWKYFPWGSGLGTFAVVYQTVEDLNKVGPFYINHAHNEYIQILVETGVWGVLLLILAVAVLTWLAVRSFSDPFSRAAAFAILILVLHSIVDYPLRMVSLITLFGFLCALLIPSSRTSGPHHTPKLI